MPSRARVLDIPPLADLLGQRDDDPLGAADITEPVAVLVLRQLANEPSLYERVVLPGYAHLDALIGRDAATDVFPVLSDHLDRFNW